MTGFAICQACAGSLNVHLVRGLGSHRNPAGCCAQCQSFACPRHGERDPATQQFRCVECLPTSLLYSAAAHSGAENELAKAIMARQPAWALGRNAWQVESPELFLEQHDLVRDRTSEILSEFYLQSSFDLDRFGAQRPGWEKIVRDLRRIQLRLAPTPQRDLLKLAGAYITFIYPNHGGERVALPTDMQVLRSALLPLPADNYIESLNDVLAP